MIGINAAKLLQRVAAPALALVFLTGAAHAQSNRTFQTPPPYPQAPIPQGPGSQSFPQFQNPNQPQARNQICLRLESQLAAIGSGNDPARADQIKRYEEAADKQQQEIDRVVAQSRRLSCEGGGLLSIFTAQNPQCTPLTNQIQQMRGNLDRILMDLERLQGYGNSASAAQRQQVIAALAQNDCGPQYRNAVARSGGGLFDALLGPGTITSNAPSEMMQSNTFRTICVRTCDGYFFPISFATVPGRFQDDERVCQRMCPAAEVTLYAHRNPGEDVNQAVSLTGAPYTALPNAFRYRQSFDKACSCRAPGQSWADALKQYGDDRTIERGDVVVTEDQAKRLSQPTPAKGQQKSDPRAKGAQPAKSAAPAPQEPAAAPAASADSASTSSDAPRHIRSVGPTFVAPAKSTPPRQ